MVQITTPSQGLQNLKWKKCGSKNEDFNVYQFGDFPFYKHDLEGIS